MQAVEEQIEQLRADIRNAVNTKLSDMAMVFDNLEQRIFENIRWSFSRQRRYRNYQDLGWLHLMELDFAEVMTYEEVLLGTHKHLFKQGMFEQSMYTAIGGTIAILDFDFDWHTFKVHEQIGSKMNNDAYPDHRLDPVAFLQKWDLQPILPPVFTVMEVDDETFNEWHYEYADAYEEWLNDSRRRNTAIQIGGWGDFRQSATQEEYVMQVNTDHGDCGAIYLGFRDDQFYGYEQMC